jgi:hypothetical protein
MVDDGRATSEAPIPIARMSGMMTRKAMTMKITNMTGIMNIPNHAMYCHQSP